MINLTFETYEEMITFAKQILEGSQAPVAVPAAQAPVAVPAAQAPVAVPSFPTTNTTPSTPVAQTVPTQIPTYNIDQIAVAAMQLKDSGRLEEFRQLLARFGVAALTQLQPNQLPELVVELQKMGVKL